MSRMISEHPWLTLISIIPYCMFVGWMLPS
jgi:hypothetical protein